MEDQTNDSEEEINEDEEEANALRLPIDVWEWLVMHRLHPSEARAVGRWAGAIGWLAFLATQQLRKWPRPSQLVGQRMFVTCCAFTLNGMCPSFCLCPIY